jgi:3-hydroxymyristoyl/3-hydroxydecanoyl-(acyl carrier protein) dehydratase
MKLPATILPYPAEFLVPHRPPMLFVRQIIERGQDTGLVDAIVPNAGIFFNKNTGIILPELYIEIMAQATAAINGWDTLNESKEPIPGFIVGIDNIRFNCHARPGETIWIEVVKKLEFGEITILEATARTDSMAIIQGEIKVWENKSNNK